MKKFVLCGAVLILATVCAGCGLSREAPEETQASTESVTETAAKSETVAEETYPDFVEELEYRLNDDKQSYSVVGIGTMLGEDIVIAPTYNNLPVTHIGERAFYRCLNLTSVTIPNSVISIGYGAFESCDRLESITLPFIGATADGMIDTHFGYIFETGFPPSLTTVIITGGSNIGDEAFMGWSNLTSITIPDSVTSIGDHAFFNCRSLTSITIPNSVTSIGHEAFFECYKLVEIYNLSSLNITKCSDNHGYIGYYALEIYTNAHEPSKVHTAGDYIFYADGDTIYLLGYTGDMYIGKNTALILPDSYNGKNYAICQYAFYQCDFFESITIPASVTSIGYEAFKDCFSLERIEVPASVTSIDSNAFLNCGSLESITFGENSQLERIGEYAFGSCCRLKNVTFGVNSQLTSIGQGAFLCDNNLTSITIPASVTSIGDEAFAACHKLLEVYNLSSLNITKGSSSNGYAGYYALNIYTPSNGESKLRSVDDYIFYVDGDTIYLIEYVGSDTMLVLPDNYGGKNYAVYKYAFACFWDYDYMASITIPSSVTSIGEHAFCMSNTINITILHGVESIGFSAFENNLLEIIKIPNSVTNIGERAFNGCSNLESITFEGTTAEWQAILKGSAWDGDTGSYTVYCTDGTVSKDGTVTLY